MKSSAQHHAPSRNWSIAVVIALLIGAYFLRSFLPTLAFAAIIAYLHAPIYNSFTRRLRMKPGIAAALVTLIALLIVVVPLTIVFVLALQQLSQLITSLQGVKISYTQVLNSANELLARFVSRSDLISSDRLQEIASQRLPDVVSGAASTALAFVSSVPGLVLQTVVFIFSFFTFLTRQKEIILALQAISPFDNKMTDLYLERIGAMTRSMFTGQFLIATLQGFASALAMFLIGLGQYFVLWWIFFTLMSFIPLGAGLITIPLGLGAMVFGRFWGGLFVVLNHMLIVSSIDNIRPWLTPKEAQLPPLLTLLGALAGVQAFGFLGVIYGPVIMIVIMTMVTTYVDRGGATYLED